MGAIAVLIQTVWLSDPAGEVRLMVTKGLTVTFTVAAGELQPLTVAVTLYVPASAAAEEEITGFWIVDEKLFGPNQS
jgi:hypothetical protein